MRAPRTIVPGYPVHVLQRGNNRQRIFDCPGDFLLFRRVFEEACERFHIAVHAYVLMTNHVHLLMTPQGEWDVSHAVQSAARRYVGYFNSRYRRSGTLWEGRFRSCNVTTEHHLFACHRYIDANPVRARMVDRPDEYLWSSHRFYAQGEPDTWLKPHAAIVALSNDAAGRLRAYRGLFETPLTDAELDEIRTATRRGANLGAVAPRPRGRPPKNGV